MLKEAGNRRGLTTFLGATKKGGGGLNREATIH